MSYPIINIDDINTLYSASESKTLAETAIFEQDKAAIARLINYAVSTGEISAIWQHPMTTALKSFVEAQGYVVTEIPSAPAGRLWNIAWGE